MACSFSGVARPLRFPCILHRNAPPSVVSLNGMRLLCRSNTFTPRLAEGRGVQTSEGVALLGWSRFQFPQWCTGVEYPSGSPSTSFVRAFWFDIPCRHLLLHCFWRPRSTDSLFSSGLEMTAPPMGMSGARCCLQAVGGPSPDHFGIWRLWRSLCGHAINPFDVDIASSHASSSCSRMSQHV